MTHAPGPWAISGKTVSSIHHQRRYAIARVDNAKFTPDANAANARLIAAAPDLLEALRGVMTWWADTLPPHGADDEMPANLFDAAHAAIARATKGGA